VVSHRRPKQPSRARVSILTAAAATAVALSAQSAAQAAPGTSTDQAKSQVEADRMASAAADESYDGAQAQQQALQKKVSLLQDEIARQQTVVNQELNRLGAVASAQYREGGIDPTVALMLSSNPTQYLNSAASAAQVNSSQAQMLAQLVAQEHTLASEKAEAAQELGAQQALLKQMAASKAQSKAKLAHAQSVLDSLTPAQKKIVNAGGGGGVTPGTSSGNPATPPNLGGVSQAAAIAMRAAMTKVGVAPYERGGSGPHVFDCSGLVMWAYAQANVSLPHYSYADESVGHAVAYADMQPGDIIVNENGAHVGLYAGNGMFLNASHPGTTVSIDPLSWFGTIVAIRRI
jgi:cell wall-associated NlpC family hydrolase